EPAVLACSIAGTNVDCNGNATGAADLTVTGGTSAYTYLWSNGSTNEDQTGLLAGTYTVTVTDANLCTTTCSVTITEPAVLSCSIVGTDADCNNNATGSADLTVIGGTTAYSYLWSNGSTNEDQTGLTAGTYTVTVTDANLCTTTCSVTINDPAALSCSIIGTNVDCNGNATGSADLTVTGGTTTYTYLWSNGVTTEDQSGLTAGTYTVTVTDANLCTTTCSVTISEPAVLACSIAGTNVDCNGNATGSADLTVTGGTTAYTYLWSNGSTNEDQNGLAAGTYTVTVTDANLCTTTCSVTITEPAVLSCSIAGTDVDCNGAATGAADLTVTGGTSAYTYLWSNGVTTEDQSGLTAGTYTVTVTDANLCTTTCSVIITEPAAILVSCSQDSVLCFSDSTGQAHVVASGGTGALSYLWSDGQTTSTAANLISGTYTVTVTDQNSCTSACSVSVLEPEVLNASCFGDNNLCNGDSLGVAIVVVSGGTLPYTYLWSSGETTASINLLPADVYTVTVTDKNGCTTQCSVTILEPPPIVATTAKRNVSCFGGKNGAGYIFGGGGVPPYTYLWDDGTTVHNNGGLQAGTYSVTITDANGCTLVTSVTITQPSQILTFILLEGPSCSGGGTGNINLLVSGGVAPYNYLWSTGATTEDITGVTAGVYWVVITDRNRCATYSIIFVTNPVPLTVNVAGTNLLCNGDSSGIAIANVNGGTAPYSYNWSNGQTAFKDTLLTPGTYSVIVTDSKGCTAIDSATITEPNVLSCVISLEDSVTCSGNNNGALSVSGTGGTKPYTYIWNTNPISNDSIVTGLTAGTYTVQIIDANSCVSYCSYTLTEPSALSCTASASSLLCFGDSNGVVTTSLTGGSGTYSYLWSDGQTGASAVGLSAGTYTVTVTDSLGCESVCSATVTQPDQLSIEYAINNVICSDSSNGSINATVNGGIAPYNYNWSDGQTTQSAIGLSSGTYFLTVTDSNGCVLADTAITVTESSPVVVGGINSTAISCNGGNDGTATAIGVTGGSAPYTYSWNTVPIQVTQVATGLSSGFYVVTVTDANGCVGKDSIELTEPLNSVTIDSTDVVGIPCTGGFGSATVYASGGTVPYTYLWSDGQTTQTANSLPAGFIIVTVTDSLGCTSQISINVPDPANLYVSLLATSDICNGSSTGTVSIDSLSGGTTPYTFLWSNGATTQNIGGLTAGYYTVTVTDNNGCTVSADAEVTASSAILGSLSKTNVSCFGGSNGTATVFNIGGTPPYFYNWSSGATVQNAMGLSTGTQVVTVSDINGCLFIDSIVITQPSVLNLVGSSFKNPKCFGTNSGTASVSINGGSPPYFYNWSHGALTPNVSGLVAGTYTVSVSDVKGCTIAPVIFILSDPPQLKIDSIIKTSTSGPGNNDGTATVYASGGTGQLMYSWNTVPVQTNATATGMSAGLYQVAVTDSNACLVVGAVTITNGPAPRIKNASYEDFFNLDVHPNPTSGIFAVHIRTNYAAIVEITIYDITGKLISNRINEMIDGHSNLDFDLSDLRKGVYWIKARNERSILIKKVIVE
ncbi:MAG: T9SS type A sorting domain-containing protein, partial [Bacteroidia bacterium]|nr:T9SS type A sorting domain-containing protein [Bacteroidia bacterium]